MTGVKTRRILYNSDGWNIFAHAARPGEELTVDAARRYVAEVAGTQVDTFLLCVNAGLLYYPNGPIPMYGQVGHETDGADPRVGANLRKLVGEGVDPVGVLIDEINTCGLECILSYRMNDVHHIEPDTPLMPPFWKSHPRWRIDAKVRFGGGYDYAVPQVRAFMLDLLKDGLRRYGDRIDGLELDWMRFPRYFQGGQESAGAEILTAFMRDVREALNETVQRTHRALVLSVRVWHRPDWCLRDGMDVFTWAGEALIDFLTISRFLRNGEGELDVKGFKSRIHGVPIYGSIEAGSHNVWPANDAERAVYNEKVRPHLMTTADQYRSEALRLWKDGIDGIYLFNFFTPRERGVEPDFALLKELGDPDTIRPPAAAAPYFKTVAELMRHLEA